MSIFESLFRFLLKAICGPVKPQEPEQPPHKPPTAYPPHRLQQQQQQQQQHGKPYYHYNNYLGHAQDPHYVSLRQRAADLDQEMDRLFDASRQAYKRGDNASRAEAKDLSDRAKELKAERQRLNQEAADWIFNQNNRGRERGEIDLHGLRVEEAVEKTEEFVDQSRREGLVELRLIVGKGIHSNNHTAVLKPRIEELMRKHKVVAELDPENSGVLVVHLDSGTRPRGRTIDPDEITKRIGDEEKGCIIM